MSDRLREIIDHKRIEVAALKARGLQRRKRQSAARPFATALDRENCLAVIAEVKKASPSKGIIKADFNPVQCAKVYEAGKAAAVSVLTDERFFMGHTDYLEQIRAAITLPVLRKDFIIDPIQVEESAGLNADALLLIAAALDDTELRDLYQAALALQVEVLIEVHSGEELERVLKLPVGLIGINNRSLSTFVTDIDTTFRLISQIPDDVVVVSESGIATAAQTQKLLRAGVSAVLVGESLMRSPDPAALIGVLSHVNTY